VDFLSQGSQMTKQLPLASIAAEQRIMGLINGAYPVIAAPSLAPARLC
jgi:hypothetical protein